MQLMEMFPLCSREELKEALDIHDTVAVAALALSANVTNDTSDSESDLLQPSFLPRKQDVVTLQDLLEQIQGNFSSDDKGKVKVDEDDVLNDALAYYKGCNFDDKTNIRVIYRGQPAADTGGVTRQFFTQLLQKISEEFFQSDTYSFCE